MNIINPIGVMQGRLLPKYQGRYQAHPVGYWQQEFSICQDVGLDCIEFIVDRNDIQKNPLLQDSGRAEMREIMQEHQVRVHSVCADYFMAAPLHRPETAEASQQMLKLLLQACRQMEISNLVIPCVDQSRLANHVEIEKFVTIMKQYSEIAADYGIFLALETDLPPAPFAELLSKISAPAVTVNYDIGNSASLGFDPIEEFKAYGEKITDVHIKDRKKDGGPEILGQGDANFGLIFDLLSDINFSGPLIMQAYRDDEGINIFKQQLHWVQPWLGKLS